MKIFMTALLCLLVVDGSLASFTKTLGSLLFGTTSDEEPDWQMAFCQVFKFRHDEDYQKVPGQFNMEGCLIEAKDKLEDLMSPWEYHQGLPSEYRLIATICVNASLTHSACISTMVTLKKHCWDLPQITLLLIQLSRTSASIHLTEMALEMSKSDARAMRFDKYLTLRNVPNLKAQLCVFEYGYIQEGSLIAIYEDLLGFYSTWTDDVTDHKPNCDCSEVISILFGLANDLPKKTRKLYEEICFNGKKKGNWRFDQLLIWRAPEIKKEMMKFVREEPINHFIELAQYSHFNWVDDVPSEEDPIWEELDFTDPQVQIFSNLLSMMASSSRPLYRFRITALSAGWSRNQLNDFIRELSMSMQVLNDECFERILTEIYQNPKYVNQPKNMWTNEPLRPRFTFIMSRLVEIAYNIVSRISPPNDQKNLNAHCDMVLWYTSRLQDLYVYDHLMDEEDLMSLLSYFIYIKNGSGDRELTTLEDTYLCIRGITKIEMEVANNHSSVSTLDKIEERIPNFRDDTMNVRNRFLCYRPLSYLISKAEDIFYNTNTQI